MAEALEFFFTDPADSAVRALWKRLDEAGVPSLSGRSHGLHRPHVTFAHGSAISPTAREDLRTRLRRVYPPTLWLRHIGIFAGAGNVLQLSATVDAELLAVHSTIHDALAGRVRNPSMTSLPGSWTPHCTLAKGLSADQLLTGLAVLVPFTPVEAPIAEIGIVNTRTGDIDPLWTA